MACSRNSGEYLLGRPIRTRFLGSYLPSSGCPPKRVNSTFHLRKGVRHSTGEPVLAGDVRRGIERTVVHPDTTPPYYTKAIVGAQNRTDAARAGGALRPNCDLRDGITANDQTGTITFHLTEPTPEFLTNWRCRTPRRCHRTRPWTCLLVRPCRPPGRT